MKIIDVYENLSKRQAAKATRLAKLKWARSHNKPLFDTTFKALPLSEQDAIFEQVKKVKGDKTLEDLFDLFNAKNVEFKVKDIPRVKPTSRIKKVLNNMKGNPLSIIGGLGGAGLGYQSMKDKNNEDSMALSIGIPGGAMVGVGAGALLKKLLKK